MGKQKMTPIGIACILLVLLVVAFMVRGSLREPEKIVLPPEPSTTEPSGPTVDNEAVDRVEVRPDTVQSAIEVLARPRVYTRTITVERYWSGGSGVSVITAAAADGWLRLDVTETDGQTRHVITGDDAVYIWYGSSRKVYSGASALTQDAEQGILTYEDILALPPERIASLGTVSFKQRGSMVTAGLRGSEADVRAKIETLHPEFYEIIPLTLEEIFISEMEERGYDYAKVVF